MIKKNNLAYVKRTFTNMNALHQPIASVFFCIMNVQCTLFPFLATSYYEKLPLFDT